jgi:thiol-disulfide isomerase/thioredoxin
MRARFQKLIRCCLVAAFALSGPASAGSALSALAATDVAISAARGGPAIVVIWSPGCLACRKSLGEIERFGAAAPRKGVTVRTVVPGDAYDEARELVSKRGLTLDVEPDGGRLDAESRRILLDHPIAYAVDGRGGIVGARAGLLGAWVLEELAGKATQAAE